MKGLFIFCFTCFIFYSSLALSQNQTLVHKDCQLVHAFWNDKGDRLLFHIYDPNKQGFTICTIKSDGGDFRVVRENKTGDKISLLANWMSDGNLIFWAKEQERLELYTMDSLGNNVKPITDKILRADNFKYGWVSSSHNNMITFTSDIDGNAEIYILNYHTNTLKRITHNVQNDFYPIFSEDGNKIVFVSERDNNLNIYSVNTDGSELTRLTTYSGHDAAPFWSADGSKIVFQSDRDGDIEVYQMNADGSNIVRITHTEGFDGEPVYGPNNAILYISTGRICTIDLKTKNKKEFLSNSSSIFRNKP